MTGKATEFLAVGTILDFLPTTEVQVHFRLFGSKKKKEVPTLCSCRQVPAYHGLTVLQKSLKYISCCVNILNS